MAARLTVHTTAREQLLNITDRVQEHVASCGLQDGVLHLWSMHTTCALTVNEGADPDVVTDMLRTLRELVPRDPTYRHAEGNSDSHVKTSLFGPGLTLLVADGALVLGTWQRVFLAEWDGPRQRQVAIVAVEGRG